MVYRLCGAYGRKIVVSVIVEGGGSGGRVAAPIAKNVFDAYFR